MDDVFTLSDHSRRLRPAFDPGLCFAVDLEATRSEPVRIHAAAGVRGDDGRAETSRNEPFAPAIAAIDAFGLDLPFLVGHKLTHFDLTFIRRAIPGRQLAHKPVIDTLLLNPLAFPRRPYHRLVKHYRSGDLAHPGRNDPEQDARISLALLAEQVEALRARNDHDELRVLAWHWLTTRSDGAAGYDALFEAVRSHGRPTEDDARAAIELLLERHGACSTAVADLLADIDRRAWETAYILAFLAEIDSRSVLAPWVRAQYPNTARMLKALRANACTDPTCRWCRERHDGRHELHRFFPEIEGFRGGADDGGRPLQQAIVDAALAGEDVFGILPTGTGKSLCYQLPALSAHEKTGALTVVVSPSIALMQDQEASLEHRGITPAVAINSRINRLERAARLERLRQGDVAILLIAPEQLRNTAVVNALTTRAIARWVVDEAHCLIQWGRDFRPDYRYLPTFIRQQVEGEERPPITLLTATARREAIEEIDDLFHRAFDCRLRLFDGGSARGNIRFAVRPVAPIAKKTSIVALLARHLPEGTPGSAIVYGATHAAVEDVAAFLREKGVVAEFYHAGLKAADRQDRQDAFMRGELRVICATKAFGMGVDKPDVRLVIHHDVPDSLESLVQEAGRAGRDGEPADAVLLFDEEALERQFKFTARSQVRQHEIAAVHQALRRLAKRKQNAARHERAGPRRDPRNENEDPDRSAVYATVGEILQHEGHQGFERDPTTNDTRVRVAVAALADADLLERDENHVHAVTAPLKVATLDEAKARITRLRRPAVDPRRLERLARALLEAGRQERLDADDLMMRAELDWSSLRRALADLESCDVAGNETTVAALVHAGVAGASEPMLERLAALERDLVDELAETVGDDTSATAGIAVRSVVHRLRQRGHERATPTLFVRLLRALADDETAAVRRDPTGDAERDRHGERDHGLRIRRLSTESVVIDVPANWQRVRTRAVARHATAARLLRCLVGKAEGRRGKDLLVQATLGELRAAERTLVDDPAQDPQAAIDRALLWLHALDVCRLDEGLTVFRSAMRITLTRERRASYTAEHHKALRRHYENRYLQINLLAEYAEQVAERGRAAAPILDDYFRLSLDAFVKRWSRRSKTELRRPTTPAQWREIVESLRDATQQSLVAEDQGNVLVLAGPGAGKTKVLVHRIAFLVRCRREDPRGIIALAYNRHAAAEIRQRLRQLIGDDAALVTVMTCHGIALRLIGRTFERAVEHQATAALATDADPFERLLDEAVELLAGDDALDDDEIDARRAEILAGFRWLFVDEYQDIKAGEYRLISALTNRWCHAKSKRGHDSATRLTLFAVGDEDQNIFGFDGASSRYIRAFTEDYDASHVYLVQNYRSTRHIIDAANQVIAPAHDRMKADHPIRIDDGRAKRPTGGEWERLDSIAKGRVTVIDASSSSWSQASAVVGELERLKALDGALELDHCAVIARHWAPLASVYQLLRHKGIEARIAHQPLPSLWRLRETRTLLEALPGHGLVRASQIRAKLPVDAGNPWLEILDEALAQHGDETEDGEQSVAFFRDWLAEWLADARIRRHGVLLVTAHSAKGLEFEHVFVLDDGWRPTGGDAAHNPDESRRLYYVAMTRARATLTLIRARTAGRLIGPTPEVTFHRTAVEPGVRIDPAVVPARFHLVLPQKGELDIDYAGRFGPDDPIHARIAQLAPGAPIRLVRDGDHWRIETTEGHAVGRTARGRDFAPAQFAALEAMVYAVVARRADESQPDFQKRLRSERWELIVPKAKIPC